MSADVMSPVRTMPDTVPPNDRTLGWIVLEWMTEWLLQPDGPDAGEIFTLTPEQVRIVLRWYAVDDRGQFVYRRGSLRRMKGWGKDPFLAAIAACEFVGPCRFGGWGPNGPQAIPHPAALVQVAAVSKDQTRNTMRLFPGMFSKACIAEYGIDMGKEIIYSGRNGVIEAVTSSPRALEGARASFVILNETHHWLANNSGHEMAEVIDRNLAKSRDGTARGMEITNAPLPGEDSVAERTWEGFQKIQEGKSRATGYYYDSLEAPADTQLSDPESLRRGLEIARGDSKWLDIDRLMAEIMDPKTPAYLSRRMYLNQLVASDDALISPQEWDVLALKDTLQPGDEIVLGFDGGKSDDATVLMALRVDDRFAQPIKVWERPDGPRGDNWEVDRETVDGVVRNTMETYNVLAFFADTALWESYVDAWSQDFRDQLAIKASSKSAIGRDMRGGLEELTRANERLVAAIGDGKLVHDGDPTLRRHVLNARRRLNRFGVSFGKEHRESQRKVDAYAALLLADMARHNLLESGKRKDTDTTVIVFN